jgi:hypothetical protein
MKRALVITALIALVPSAFATTTAFADGGLDAAMATSAATPQPGAAITGSAEASPTGSRIEAAARYCGVPTDPSFVASSLPDEARPSIRYYTDINALMALGAASTIYSDEGELVLNDMMCALELLGLPESVWQRPADTNIGAMFLEDRWDGLFLGWSYPTIGGGSNMVLMEDVPVQNWSPPSGGNVWTPSDSDDSISDDTYDDYESGDLDCEDIGEEVYIDDDPNGLDADGDGIGCEGW